ncbi:hypothetical protein OG713_45110 (plasmid) [Streptomyces sp. NBC_00723]|uniref:hypothetical protein n=1 Tax=Streptomyces sp. NBC_00723 TaxID=2903673 RepID=UPI002F91B4D4
MDNLDEIAKDIYDFARAQASGKSQKRGSAARFDLPNGQHGGIVASKLAEMYRMENQGGLFSSVRNVLTAKNLSASRGAGKAKEAIALYERSRQEVYEVTGDKINKLHAAFKEWERVDAKRAEFFASQFDHERSAAATSPPGRGSDQFSQVAFASYSDAVNDTVYQLEETASRARQKIDSAYSALERVRAIEMDRTPYGSPDTSENMHDGMKRVADFVSQVTNDLEAATKNAQSKIAELGTNYRQLIGEDALVRRPHAAQSTINGLSVRDAAGLQPRKASTFAPQAQMLSFDGRGRSSESVNALNPEGALSTRELARMKPAAETPSHSAGSSTAAPARPQGQRSHRQRM